MIVVDCTVLFKLVADVDDSAGLEHLRGLDSDWRAPDFWEIEFAGVVRKYERAGRISTSAGDSYCEHALEILADGVQQMPVWRALETSRRTGCSVYDSLYIALAEELQTNLYTHDTEILRKCPRLARKP